MKDKRDGFKNTNMTDNDLNNKNYSILGHLPFGRCLYFLTDLIIQHRGTSSASKQKPDLIGLTYCFFTKNVV